VKPVGAAPELTPKPREAPVSTYSIWAPFDGTILDREMIVPGVAVDTTHRIFTMANLSTVWVEVSIHEDDFDRLGRTLTGSKVRFRTPAYLNREFEGEVIYSGDLVEEKSRSVKLLATAKNPDRGLKPGMFVEVEVLSPRKDAVVKIPATAVLTEGSHSFVFVRNAPEKFTRREVEAENPRKLSVVILRGLERGEEIVVTGGYKLKALSMDLMEAEH
jgi:RND family efflux transporter MFP subunit